MKRLKIFTAALVLVVVAISVSASTVSNYHSKALVTRCWHFTDPTNNGVGPTESEVTTSSNYSEILPTGTEPNNCFPPRQVLCSICFSDALYPINSNNQPNFSGSQTLTNEVKVNGRNPANHGATINGIKYFFKER